MRGRCRAQSNLLLVDGHASTPVSNPRSLACLCSERRLSITKSMEAQVTSDERALTGLYKAYSHELHRFARRRVGLDEADDVVQDAYLHILQHGAAAAALEHPRAYLFRITANLVIDQARKNKVRTVYRSERTAEMEQSSSGRSASEDTMELYCIHAALEELPPQCRKAFLLNRIDGLTYPEIAKELGLSVRTIERYMIKALTHLRELVERQRRVFRS